MAKSAQVGCLMSTTRMPSSALFSLSGEEELLDACITRAPERPVVAERRRHVPKSRVGHDDALHHGGQADRADLPEVVDPDPEQLLRELRLLLGPDRLGLVADLPDALDRGVPVEAPGRPRSRP